MKIVAFYSDKKSNVGPTSPAAINKLNYIIESINRCGKNVELLSLCTISENKRIKKHSINVNENFVIRYSTCFPKKAFLGKVFHKIFDPLKIFFFLNKNINKKETIYIYHCNSYLKILKFLIKKKKVNLLLEVEEIYGDVTSDRKLVLKENRIFNLANYFIFASESLNRRVNSNNKPSLIVYGSYSEKPVNGKKFNDEKTHCVYAGTFNEIKGGAENAIKSALYLDDKYQMHILGFGNDEEKNKILSLIEETNLKTKCNVKFEGLLLGQDYDSFLGKCDIGLNTQNPIGAFNESSFPSKVLSFMANGLNVVTFDLPVLRESKISNFMNYCHANNPMSIAETIKSINLKKSITQREYIKKLDDEFVLNLSRMLETNE